MGELADSPFASLYVERVLVGLPRQPASAALHTATMWFLPDAAVRGDRIHHWAPLVPIGTHY